MLSIPLYLLLFFYLLFLVLFFVFMAVNLYHIIGSGSATFASFFVTFILLAVSALLLYGTWVNMPDIDWRQPLVLFDSGWFGTNNSF